MLTQKGLLGVVTPLVAFLEHLEELCVWEGDGLINK